MTETKCACNNRTICYDCWTAGKRVPGFGLIPRISKDGEKLIPVEMPDGNTNNTRE